MKHPLLGATLLMALLGTGSASAQIKLVNPVPQKVSTTGELKAAPASWRLVSDKNRSSSIAAKALCAYSAVKQLPNAKYAVTIGIKGDKAIKKVEKLIPNNP